LPARLRKLAQLGEVAGQVNRHGRKMVEVIITDYTLTRLALAAKIPTGARTEGLSVFGYHG
jgi:hypothetical protein